MILNIIMGCIAGVFAGLYFRVRLNNRLLSADAAHLLDEIGASRLRYLALEQGMDEQADAYEQQFLSFNEKIDALENIDRAQQTELEAREALIETLSETVSYHNEHCLPVLDHLPLSGA